MIDAAIRSWLLTQYQVTNLVGATGVFVDDVPQNTTPASPNFIVVSVISKDENITLDGGNVPSGGLFTAEIDIDCKGRTRAAASALGDAITPLFRNFSGSLGGGLETVNAVESIGDANAKDPDPLYAGDQSFFRRTLSYQVYYRPLA